MDEFALIRRYFAALTPARADIALGIGDDCALLAPPPGELLAISTDTLIAGRHFPVETAAADIGWKALAVNLSDLAAMGARPWACTLALSLPHADEHWLREFTKGFGELMAPSGIALIGGDTTRGSLSITVTVLGTLPAGQALRRDGARPGDLICVTGTLGDAALALRRWQRGLAVDDDDARCLRARLDRPTPRNDAGLALRGLAHAAIDLSDGLLGDLRHVLEASGCGATVETAALPMSAAFARSSERDDPVERLALQASGGDDYELCVCVPPEQLAAASAACAGLPLTVIGRIDAEAGLRLRNGDGAIIAAPAHSFRHF